MFKAPRDVYDNQGQTKGDQVGCSVGSDHSGRWRKQLHERQWKLQRELEEVQDALHILANDETVNKVIKVFEVAQK